MGGARFSEFFLRRPYNASANFDALKCSYRPPHPRGWGGRAGARGGRGVAAGRPGAGGGGGWSELKPPWAGSPPGRGPRETD